MTLLKKIQRSVNPIKFALAHLTQIIDEGLLETVCDRLEPFHIVELAISSWDDPNKIELLDKQYQKKMPRKTLQHPTSFLLENIGTPSISHSF